MNSQIKELTNLEDFKKVYKVFSGPPYNEKGSMSYGIASKIGFKQIPNVFQEVERERTNGLIETMQNIFIEIDLNSLNKDNLKQGIKMVNSNQEQER